MLRLCIWALLAALLGVPSSAPAQSEDLETLNGRVTELFIAGNVADALPLATRAAELTRAQRGEHDPLYATALGNLGVVLALSDRLDEAEHLLRTALAIDEARYGPAHAKGAVRINYLSLLYQRRGNNTEGAKLAQLAQSIIELSSQEKAGGPEDLGVGVAVHDIAHQYQSLGWYGSAELLYRRALDTFVKVRGPVHPDVGKLANNFAQLYQLQGRFGEAEALYQRALLVYEQALPAEHPDIAGTLNNLATLFLTQDRHSDAEPLLERALAISEKTLAADDPELATALSNLASVYRSRGRYADAERNYDRALVIDRNALGPEAIEVTTTTRKLAHVYRAQGRNTEAEALYLQAQTIIEKRMGSSHSDFAGALNDLAALYTNLGQYAEAEQLYERALSIRKNAQPSDDVKLAVLLQNLADLYLKQRDWGRALHFSRRSTGLIVQHDAREMNERIGQTLRGTTKSQESRFRHWFAGSIVAAYGLSSQVGTADKELMREAFVTAQWSQNSEAAAALAQMAARVAATKPALVNIVRERQNIVGEQRRLYGSRIAAIGQASAKGGAPDEAADLLTRVSEMSSRIETIDKRLVTEFADFAEFSRLTPLSVEETQSQLRENEALVSIHDSPDETFVWTITKTYASWHRVDLGTKDLAHKVGILRCGLDQTLWADHAAAEKCAADVKSARPTEMVKYGGQDVLFAVLPFDTVVAHELYKAILAPIERLIKGKHLLLVPSGPLTSLPFSVLVTSPSQQRIPRSFAAYRDVSWLGSSQAMSVLPSVASLRSLRKLARGGTAPTAYLGIGNPLLEGNARDANDRRRAEEARSKQQCQKMLGKRIAGVGARPLASFAKLFRGVAADIEEVRAWSPLPETADELCDVGRRLGIPSQIMLGARATEGTLKDMSAKGTLDQYTILHFATHGALTGQVGGAAEPGLILTPPPRGTNDAAALERDDGFLTASEIAGLKLNADWVILSACNTAGGQTEGAPALSGMARAFFYAGARALLVSHWEVGSDAAVKLTTRAFTELNAKPGIGRAEALRASMRELIRKGPAYEAHPSAWAPFVVVGEGGHGE